MTSSAGSRAAPATSAAPEVSTSPAKPHRAASKPDSAKPKAIHWGLVPAKPVIPIGSTRPAAAASKPAPPPGRAVGRQAPAAPAEKPKLSEGQVDFCNVVYHCGLPMPPRYCPDSAAVPKPGFTYDSARCLEARLLTQRGVGPSHPLVGYKLYRFLGMEYRVIYNVESDIPISEQRLEYLLNDLPLAARLVSYFQKEPYTAEYVDTERKYFKGTKGKRLKGEARLISGGMDENRLFYFGYGVATVAWWTLKGPALLDFNFAPKDKGIHYSMKILVFPGNGIINGIMNLGLFKKVVYGKIKEVLEDITASAKKLADGGGKDILASKDWTPDEKKKIEAFLKLP